MNTIKLTVQEAVIKRQELINGGYVVIFYPALWGGNAHATNRYWCALGLDGYVDFGSLQYLERSILSDGAKYVIIRTKR